MEEKETEVRKLQLALREKERDLERLRCILTNNEETITVCFMSMIFLIFSFMFDNPENDVQSLCVRAEYRWPYAQ